MAYSTSETSNNTTEVVEETVRDQFMKRWLELSQDGNVTFHCSQHLDDEKWYDQYITERILSKGDPFIVEGTIGESFFVLLKGWVGIKITRFKDRDICRLFAGDNFGQRALGKKATRTASVIAGCDDCWAFEVSYDALDAEQKSKLTIQIDDDSESEEDPENEEETKMDEDDTKMPGFTKAQTRQFKLKGFGWREVHSSMSALEIRRLEDIISDIPSMHELNQHQLQRLIQSMSRCKIEPNPEETEGTNLGNGPTASMSSMRRMSAPHGLTAEQKQIDTLIHGRARMLSVVARYSSVLRHAKKWKQALENHRSPKNVEKIKKRDPWQLTVAGELADFLYIIERGKFNIRDENGEIVEEGCKQQIVGYPSIRFNTNSKYTVEVTQNACRAFKVDRAHFVKAMDVVIKSDTVKIAEFLREIPLLGRLSDSDLLGLAKDCDSKIYMENETVLHRKTMITKLYIVRNGKLCRWDGKMDGNRTELRRYSYFGDKCLAGMIKPSPFVYNAKEFCEVIEIERADLVPFVELEMLRFTARKMEKKRKGTGTNVGTVDTSRQMDTVSDSSFDRENNMIDRDNFSAIANIQAIAENAKLLTGFGRATRGPRASTLFHSPRNRASIVFRPSRISFNKQGTDSDALGNVASRASSLVNKMRYHWIYNMTSLSCVKEGQILEHFPDGYVKICEVYNEKVRYNSRRRHRRRSQDQRMKFIGGLKRINKAVGNIKYCSREIQALKKIQSIFVPSIYSVFDRDYDVCILMDLCLGGTLKRLRYSNSTKGIFEELENVRFYAANIALAMDHIHSEGLLYRNLTLSNLRICENGYLKLFNFQHAIFLPAVSTLSLCAKGNMNRSAPEVIYKRKSDITDAVDWWMFGIIVAEMIVGFNVFHDVEKQRRSDQTFYIKKRISHCAALLRKHGAHSSAVSLVQRCLQFNHEKRMDIKTIKKHSFFSSIDWDSIQLQRFKPPFLPTINHPMDLSNWDYRSIKQDSSIFEVTKNLWPKNAKMWTELFSSNLHNVVFS